MKIYEVTKRNYRVHSTETDEDLNATYATLAKQCGNALTAMHDGRLIMRGAKLPTFDAVQFVEPARTKRESR